MDHLHEQFPGGIRRNDSGQTFYLVGDLFRSHSLILSLPVVKQLEQASFLMAQCHSLLNQADNRLHISDILMRKEAIASLTPTQEPEPLQFRDTYGTSWDETHQDQAALLKIDKHIKTLTWASHYLRQASLSTRLICGIHAKLADTMALQPAEDASQTPSDSQLGTSGLHSGLRQSTYRKGRMPADMNNIEQPDFIPPSAEYIEPAMANVEQFIQDSEIQLPILIKAALLHYQLMIIRPFENYNEAVFSILNTLIFMQNNLPIRSQIYFSNVLKKDKNLYYEKLNNAKQSFKELIEWISFFIDSIITSTQRNIFIIQGLTDIEKTLKSEKLPLLGRREKHAKLLLRELFSTPIIKSNEVIKKLGVSSQTAHYLIDDFVRLGILKETTGRKRNRIFEFSVFFDIL